MPEDNEIDNLRAELDGADRDLVELLARRQALVTRIGRAKQRDERATRDFSRERDVLDRAEAHAATLGVDASVARDVMLRLIEASLAVQERDRVARAGGGSGLRAVVIGGAGQMGRWMVGFLATQGYAVTVVDPAGAVPGFTWHAQVEHDVCDADVVVVATPLHATDRVLRALARAPRRALIFDLGSLKSPLRGGLRALADAGARVTSVHPMFGPDTRLLSGRHIAFVDVGNAEATAAARAIFADTMASQVEMTLEAHDRLMAWVLGLSHATNIAFFTAVAQSGETAERLSALSSTTFDAQLGVAGRVAHEDPRLYFEIQAMNEYGLESVTALLYAVERLRAVVRAGDAEGFAGLMEQGRAWVDGHNLRAAGTR